ncbi:MAG: phosphatase PAP2 family protein [Fibrobacteria bacterium]|nr:phosphatase PAP2 family protein [Fibrobacteria bacterium]
MYYKSLIISYFIAFYFISPPEASQAFTSKAKLDIPLVSTAFIGCIYSQIQFNQLSPTHLTQLEKENLPLHERWITELYSENADLASDIFTLGLLTPFFFSWQESRVQKRSSVLITDLLMFSEALALSSALNLFVRSVGDNPRPLVYNEKVPEKSRKAAEASSSFYSGHVSGAFLTAVYTSYVFQKRNPGSKWSRWVWSTSLLMSTTVAALRVAAGKHFLADIAAGALSGSAFGFFIPWIHLHNPASSRISLAATPRNTTFSISF